jgi:hypothetical protein
MNPIAATVFISLDQTYSIEDSLAANHLSVMAGVDRKDIPLGLLSTEGEPRDKEAAIGLLKSYALITRRPAESAMILHQLVHLATQQ